jgi:D-alanine-D-alanine ligase
MMRSDALRGGAAGRSGGNGPSQLQGGTMSDRLRLALVFGGRSDEHDVSVVSARSVDRALDRTRYEVIPMAIDRAGLWADADTAAEVLRSSGDRPDLVRTFEGRHRIDPRLVEIGDRGGDPGSGETGRGRAVDVVMPVLHGPFGEDGTIQGMLEMLDLPYVGSDTTASALCMHKLFTKRLLARAGLATPAWIGIDRYRLEHEPRLVRERCLELGLPIFVKPARLGSSVGVSRVADPAALDAALELALAHDELILAERGINGRELEVAVLGDRQPRASLPGEIIPSHEFYDYEDKYLDNTCQLIAPARLEPSEQAAAQRLALEVFSLLGCEGMARVDLFLERGTRQLYVNEVNTIPGFTSISMYPMLWERSGLAYPRLIDELIGLARARHRRRRRPS